MRPSLRDEFATRVVVADGAMGTMLQAADPSMDDFTGLEGCNEILNLTRPDIVASVHDAYFSVGVDCVETNTFGANLAALAEYGIENQVYELSEAGARIARTTADAHTAADGRPRWVLGSMGPGTKLPTLGHVTYEPLREAFQRNAEGLIRGGADALLIETSQDLLQTKAAVIGARRALDWVGVDLPVIVQVTVETTGTMLLGSEIGAALTALEPLGIDMIGLNCATGPAEMAEHLRHLARHARIPISVMPNAGLPVLTSDGAHYPLSPAELADAQEAFVRDYGPALVGGCCGTTPEHLREIVERVRGAAVLDRHPVPEPGASSLYSHVPFRQDTAYLAIGERTNANGSKKFREAMLEGRWDDCVEIARDQIREGAHMLDLCVDYVGRDGTADMAELAGRFATASTLPIVLDSTEIGVLRAGLEKLGGRAVVNSVNYEDGDGPESRFAQVTALAKEHGAALMALTIDEEGQARSVEHKVAVAERLIADLTGNWGIRESDILIDTLTFTICTGQEESRKDGVATIEAIRELKRRHPDVQTTLGLSNISFGLNPAARIVLNSVFLDECVKAGLDSAIVHASKILPIARLEPEQVAVALDLIHDRRREGYDPLQRFLQMFEGATAKSLKAGKAEELLALPLDERLKRRIVDGEKNGLEADLDEALTLRPALEIVNEILLDGMKTVGELFGSGQMQLPFVLQSAEVMKTAVAHLEPHMERTADGEGGVGKGTIVLATVRGDVHDIGKNLVDIILSNNGYNVVNIGIKQPVSAHEGEPPGAERARPRRPLPRDPRRRRPHQGVRRTGPPRAVRGRGAVRPRRLRGPAAHGRAHGRQTRRPRSRTPAAQAPPRTQAHRTPSGGPGTRTGRPLRRRRRQPRTRAPLPRDRGRPGHPARRLRPLAGRDGPLQGPVGPQGRRHHRDGGPAAPARPARPDRTREPRRSGRRVRLVPLCVQGRRPARPGRGRR